MQEPSQRRAGGGRGGLDKQPERTERDKGWRDLLLGHCDDSPSRAAQSRQDLGDPNRFRGGYPVGDGWLCREPYEPIRARQPGRCKGRAIRRLDGEQAWPRPNLAAPLEFIEAAFEAEYVAAVPRGHEDVVGNPKAELLPQFKGERFRALDKEGLPVVAGIEAIADRDERRFGDVLP